MSDDTRPAGTGGAGAPEVPIELAHSAALILDQISDAFYALDEQWRFTYINRKAAELWGRRREDLIGRIVWEVFPQAVGSEAHERHLAAAREGRPITFETISSVLRRWIEVNIHPGPTGLTVYFRDITERKQVEERLRESEARLAAELSAARRLQEVSTLLIQEGDIDALYHQILDAAVGLMRSDMASMQMLDHDRGDLRLLAWKGFHPASAALWERVRARSGSTCGAALCTGQRVVMADIETCDSIIGTSDLDAYRRSGIRAAQSTPLISRSGRPLGMISTHWRDPHQPTDRDLRLLDVLARQAADLIERAHAEAALRNSEARLRATYEHVQVGICEVDLAGRFLRVNETFCRITGYAREELIGRTLPDIAHPDDTGAELDELRRLKAGEIASLRTDKRYIRNDGRPVWVSVSATLIRDAAGRPLYALAAVEDITERKQTEEHQRLLVAELSHRVKNTLAVVQAIAGQTLRRAPSLEGFAGSFDGRLRALAGVHGLLTESNWRRADLRRLVRKTLEAHGTGEGSAALAGPDLGLTPKQTLALGLVLHELATNAAKYGALSVPNGRLEIAWAIEAGSGDARFRLDWVERDGPTVPASRAEGFGAQLIRRSIAYELAGESELSYEPAGLRCTIAFPWCAPTRHR